MAMFRILESGGGVHEIEADNFTINGEWVILTSMKQSLVELDPLPKEAFIGAFKDVVGFFAIGDDGEPIDLVK